MHFRNYISFFSILMALALPLCGESKRRAAMRSKNKVVAALDQGPDLLARTLGIDTAQEDLETEMPEVSSEEKNGNEPLENHTAPTPTETAPELKTDEPVASALADLPESIVLEDTPLHIDDATVELYFENADLQNFVKQIEDLFDITFIMDDAIEPLPQNAKTLKGNKITYRTEKPITRARTWSIFNTFLNIAGFAIIPHSNERTYRIVLLTQAQRGPVPTYIGIPSETLPETDELIRYVYFLENNTIEGIRGIIEQFRSTASTAVYLNEHRGFILTDIAYNIKKLMEIIHELDKVSMPESLSVLKLRQADAKQIKELYESLTGGEKQQPFGPRPPAQPKKPASLALPENVTIIAEPRNNCLILLGPKAAREQIEEFVKTIDVSIDQAYSPVHTYQLKYANAETIAEIMNNVTKFGTDTEAGKSGGVRGGDKYMRPMSFIAEPTTNVLIIKGHYEDYLKSLQVLEKLDEDQPQVAIEVLLLGVTADKTKALGAQLRSKVDGPGLGGGISGLVGNQIKFQTSGLFASGTASGIVENSDPNSFGVKRLLGNLLDLVSGAGVANTIISMGEDIYGVWGIMQLLETVSNVQVVSNPFFIATNKTPALVELGETRRVPTALVAAATQNAEITAFGNEEANTQVQITPQINSDGMIVLDLEIDYDNFLNTQDLNSPTKETRKIKTSTIMSDKQVLAIGGLIRQTINDSVNRVPLLGDIPFFGWLFKNKQKEKIDENLLILISTRIVEPKNAKDLSRYNKKHFDQYRGTLDNLEGATSKRDPIHKIYFKEDKTERISQDFIFEHAEKRKKSGRSKMKDKLIKAQKEVEQKAATQMAASQMPRPLQLMAQGNNFMPNLETTAAPLAPLRTAHGPHSLEQRPNATIQRAALTPTIPPPPIVVATRASTQQEQPAQPAEAKLDKMRAKRRSDLSLSPLLAHTNEQSARSTA